MMIEFYQFNLSGPCRGVHMTLEALGLEYSSKVINLWKGEQREARFLKINPRGLVPTVIDGSICLSESRAIAAYLCNKYSTPSTEHLYPPAPEQRARVDELLYASEWIFETMKDFVNPPGVVLLGEKPNYHKEQDVNKALRYLEQTLGEGGFIAGPKETIADLFMITGCVMPRLINSRVYDNYPKLTKWMGRVEQLAFYDLCNKQALADFKRQMQSALHPDGTQL